jgi:hypothetical protein
MRVRSQLRTNNEQRQPTATAEAEPRFLPPQQPSQTNKPSHFNNLTRCTHALKANYEPRTNNQQRQPTAHCGSRAPISASATTLPDEQPKRFQQPNSVYPRFSRDTSPWPTTNHELQRTTPENSPLRKQSTDFCLRNNPPKRTNQAISTT